MNRFNCMY